MWAFGFFLPSPALGINIQAFKIKQAALFFIAFKEGCLIVELKQGLYSKSCLLSHIEMKKN